MTERTRRPWYKHPAFLVPALGIGIGGLVSVILGAIHGPYGGPYPSGDQSAATQPTTPSPSAAVVPNVVNLRTSDARRALAESGYVVVIVSKAAPQDKGTVIGEDPPVGQALAPGSSVHMIVSLGWPTLPSWDPFAPVKVDVAIKRIRKAGFRIKGVKWRYSLHSQDRLIRTIPAGGKQYAPGTKVELVATKLPACTPGYSPCLPPHLVGSGTFAYLADYNCANGTSSAPYYAYGLIHVTGSDPYGLDGDNDHWGCES